MIVHKLCDVVDPQDSPVRATRATLPSCEYNVVLCTEVCIYVAQFSLILPVEEMGVPTKSPSLPVKEAPSEWARKIKSVSSQLSSLKGFTTYTVLLF